MQHHSAIAGESQVRLGGGGAVPRQRIDGCSISPVSELLHKGMGLSPLFRTRPCPQLSLPFFPSSCRFESPLLLPSPCECGQSRPHRG